MKLAFDKLKVEKKYKDYGIYTCPIWGQKYKDLQQSQVDVFEEIISVEDHLADGGFGSWLRESLIDMSSHLKLKNMAFSSNIIGAVGSEQYLLKLGGF